MAKPAEWSRSLQTRACRPEEWMGVVARVPGWTGSAVALERDRRECRTIVGHRAGRSDTGGELELLGVLLA